VCTRRRPCSPPLSRERGGGDRRSMPVGHLSPGRRRTVAVAQPPPGGAAPIHSSRIDRGPDDPRVGSLVRCFTRRIHSALVRGSPTCRAHEPSYPEGNFEWNQLLGGSIGLAPPCHTRTTAICTSGQILTSTTVSHGFVMEWHSSPPFGSRDLTCTRILVHRTPGPVFHAAQHRSHARPRPVGSRLPNDDRGATSHLDKR